MPKFSRRSVRGYSLIEVLAASAVLGLAAAAGASLLGSMAVQEEMSHRVAVVRNHQENMARVWQLGLSPAEVDALMPTAAGSEPLANVLFGSPAILPSGNVSLGADGGATVELAVCRASVNVSLQALPVTEEGAPHDMVVCRPTIR
ncbi:MAG: prepilin-type N-terminal cleavage/methylation domain-containing protein [Verrucomicrobiales bacterium]|nr:prepilin-type N-terminal cleavage/methylation domain-containing protein [Verrucomicrobiales bacterium]